MKQVIAIIRPYLAEKVLENLRLAPLEALAVREVKGFGRQKSYLEEYRAGEFESVFLPKVEIDRSAVLEQLTAAGPSRNHTGVPCSRLSEAPRNCVTKVASGKSTACRGHSQVAALD